MYEAAVPERGGRSRSFYHEYDGGNGPFGLSHDAIYERRDYSRLLDRPTSGGPAQPSVLSEGSGRLGARPGSAVGTQEEGVSGLKSEV